jgi:hypothetical protein
MCSSAWKVLSPHSGLTDQRQLQDVEAMLERIEAQAEEIEEMDIDRCGHRRSNL